MWPISVRFDFKVRKNKQNKTSNKESYQRRRMNNTNGAHALETVLVVASFVVVVVCSLACLLPENRFTLVCSIIGVVVVLDPMQELLYA